MSYRRLHARDAVTLGFTPEEEQQLLAAEADEGKKLDELLEISRRADAMRTITMIATIGGALYSLARLGELISGHRGHF